MDAVVDADVVDPVDADVVDPVDAVDFCFSEMDSALCMEGVDFSLTIEAQDLIEYNECNNN